MKLTLSTWNSVNINSSPYMSYIQVGQLSNLIRQPLLVTRANEYPSITGIVEQGSVLVIGVSFVPGTNINTYRENLKGIFFGDRLRHDIVATDDNDGSKAYYRTGFPVRLVQESERTPNSFYVTIQTEYPYWQLVTPTSDSWDITASGDSDVVANIGNLPSQPIFTITPNTTKTAGYKYWRYVSIYNNLDNAFTLPLDITNGGLDVQSLINSNKMQASGNDFRVWNNGSFSDRWLYGMDSDSDPAKCWSNINLIQDTQAPISVSVDSDDTVFQFAVTASNLSFLTTLKDVPNFTLLIDNEAVTFNPTNVNLITYQITSIVRGQKNTTLASHSASSIVRYISNDLFIMYGDSDATAPDINDNNKPIFDLSSSNLLWHYTNFFDENAKNRPGSWKPELKASRTKLSYYFTGPTNTFVNPSTALGLAEVNSADFTQGHETATVIWTYTNPLGMTDVNYSGEKYRTGSWPGIVGLQKLQPNLAWFTVQNEDTPVSALVWETFTRTNDLSGTYNSIRFAIDGTLSSVFNEMAMAYFDSVDIAFDSDNAPTIAMGNETTINFFDFKITNSTTGEYILCTTPCPVNTPLVIDCENKKAYLSDGRQVPIRLSSDRNDWLNLASGNNSLKYEDVGTANVHINIAHRDKNL